MSDFKAPFPVAKKRSGDSRSVSELVEEKRRRREQEQEDLYIRDDSGNITGVDGEEDMQGR